MSHPSTTTEVPTAETLAEYLECPEEFVKCPHLGQVSKKDLVNFIDTLLRVPEVAKAAVKHVKFEGCPQRMNVPRLESMLETFKTAGCCQAAHIAVRRARAHAGV